MYWTRRLSLAAFLTAVPAFAGSAIGIFFFPLADESESITCSGKLDAFLPLTVQTSRQAMSLSFQLPSGLGNRACALHIDVDEQVQGGCDDRIGGNPRHLLTGVVKRSRENVTLSWQNGPNTEGGLQMDLRGDESILDVKLELPGGRQLLGALFCRPD